MFNPHTHYPNGAVRPEHAAPVPNNVEGKHYVDVQEYEVRTAILRTHLRDLLALVDYLLSEEEHDRYNAVVLDSYTRSWKHTDEARSK